MGSCPQPSVVIFSKAQSSCELWPGIILFALNWTKEPPDPRKTKDNGDSHRYFGMLDLAVSTNFPYPAGQSLRLSMEAHSIYTKSKCTQRFLCSKGKMV